MSSDDYEGLEGGRELVASLKQKKFGEGFLDAFDILVGRKKAPA